MTTRHGKSLSTYWLLDCDNTAICIPDDSGNWTYHIFKNIVSSDLLKSCADADSQIANPERSALSFVMIVWSIVASADYNLDRTFKGRKYQRKKKQKYFKNQILPPRLWTALEKLSLIILSTHMGQNKLPFRLPSISGQN